MGWGAKERCRIFFARGSNPYDTMGGVPSNQRGCSEVGGWWRANGGKHKKAIQTFATLVNPRPYHSLGNQTMGLQKKRLWCLIGNIFIPLPVSSKRRLEANRYGGRR